MSRIEQLIDEIEEYVEGCKPAPFSQSKIIVQKEELYELLTELRLKTPDEIKRYQKIIAQKDKIISDAQAQAEQMIAETEAYAAALVEEHEIMLKAYEKAEQTINAANAQAQEIVDSANQEADEVRVSALSYTQGLIANIQSVVENSLEIARANSEGLINGLSQNLNILVSNNEALSEQISNKPEPAVAQQAETPKAPEEEKEEAAPEIEEDDVDEIIEEEQIEEEEIEEAPAPKKPAKKSKKPLFVVEDDFDDEEEDDDYDDID